MTMKTTILAIFFTGMSAVSAQQATPAPLAFEVASIKPNVSEDGHTHVGDHPGGLEMTNVSLRQCVWTAYGIQDSNLVAPDWLASTYFDILAKPPADHPEKYLQPMLKTLLEERFKLVAHRETRVLPAYELVIGKGGLKVQEVEAGPDKTSSSRTTFNGKKTTMQRLADFLASVLNRPVIDKTETKGVFDIQLKFAPEATAAREPRAGDASAPSIFTALQEQVGLKLQSEKLPVEVVVVDHIERVPTEN
jgi:uncharacterized protein (TIGR03435 family)